MDECRLVNRRHTRHSSLAGVLTCSLLHTGDDAVGGDDKQWVLKRDDSTVGQSTTTQGKTNDECRHACIATTWCAGYVYKHTDDSSKCSSEPEFCKGACTLLETLKVWRTSVGSVNSYRCSGDHHSLTAEAFSIPAAMPPSLRPVLVHTALCWRWWCCRSRPGAAPPPVG